MKIGKREISLIKWGVVMIIIALVILVIYLIINTNKKVTSVNDFKSVKEVIEYMGSEYISESRVNAEFPNVIKLKFKYPLYEKDNKSNENYFNQMITMIAKVKGYSNFMLQDSDNNIVIRVTCDRPSLSIVNVNINDVDNYFAIKNNNIVLDNYTSVNSVSISVGSNTLSNLIKNDWKYDQSIFGTKDSDYEDYEIYFDEGIEVRRLFNDVLTDTSETTTEKVFNIVFTKKYKDRIINNITTNSSLDEVINILGTPQYGTRENGLIGYKSDKMYIFFSDGQVSIYRNESPKKDNFSKIVTKFLAEKNSSNLIDSLTEIWPDYDKSTNNNSNNSKMLAYSIYGLKVQFNITNEHGIILYDEFSGPVTEDATYEELIGKSKELPKNIYIKNTSLLYENEMSRTFNFYDTQYMKQTDKFVAMSTSLGQDEFTIRFLSKTDEYPNSELANIVYKFEWANDINFIYSRKGQGIYLYNVVTKENKVIIEGDSDFNITNYENGTLSYDNTSVKVKI